jgi:DNA-directed RNA polymerase subunit RPC12/RpoP
MPKLIPARYGNAIAWKQDELPAAPQGAPEQRPDRCQTCWTSHARAIPLQGKACPRCGAVVVKGER